MSEKPKKLPWFKKEVLVALNKMVDKGFRLPLYSQPGLMIFISRGVAGEYFIDVYLREEYADVWHWVPVPLDVYKGVLDSAKMIIGAGKQESKGDGEHE